MDLKARPKAYGEVTVATDVSGVELLQTVDNDEQDSDHSDDSACDDSDNDQQNDLMSINDDGDDDESQLCSDDTESDDDEAKDSGVISEDEDESSGFEAGDSDTDEEDDDVSDNDEDGDQDVETKSKLKDSSKKRKFTDFDGRIIAADTSLRALKKLAGAKVGDVLPESQDGILSNEDFQRIKKLKVSLAYSVSSIFNTCSFC